MRRKNNAMVTSRYKAVMASKDGHWLAENSVPEGWKRARLEDIAEVNPERPRLNVDDEVPTTFIPMAAVAEDCVGIAAREIRPYREVSRGYTYFEENDVLLAKITPCLQNGKHALATSLESGFGFGTTEFHVIKAGLKIDPRHLFRILTSPANIERCERSFNGTAGQQRVHPDTVRGLPLLLPPLHEQRAIAAVLDSIDEAIERTEAVIAATEQLRDSLLHELLTRGVPGWHTEWKDVPGLGAIPADWDVVRLGDVCSPPEYGAGAPARPLDPSLPRYVRITDLTDDGRLRSDDACSADPSLVNGYELKPGDLLFARSGATVGKTYMHRAIDGPCVYAGYLIRFRATPDLVLPGFLELVTHSEFYSRWVASMYRAGAQPNINAPEYSALKLPLPRLGEQSTITAGLDGIGNALNQARKEWEGLQTLKASTADALLTGRVRVQVTQGPGMRNGQA